MIRPPNGVTQRAAIPCAAMRDRLDTAVAAHGLAVAGAVLGRPRERVKRCGWSVPTIARTLMLACMTIAAIGCSPASTAPTSPPTAGSAAAPRDINVIMRDYLFEPDPIVLHPGETVRFNIINAGLLAHEFVLGDATVQAAWASAEAAATPPGFTATPPPVSLAPDLAGFRVYLDSGQSTSATYQVPVHQVLELACQIPGHVEQGMIGTIELIPAEGP